MPGRLRYSIKDVDGTAERKGPANRCGVPPLAHVKVAALRAVAIAILERSLERADTVRLPVDGHGQRAIAHFGGDGGRCCDGVANVEDFLAAGTSRNIKDGDAPRSTIQVKRKVPAIIPPQEEET